MISYRSVQELVDLAAAQNEPISKLVLREQAQSLEKTEQALFSQMADSFAVMRESVANGIRKELRSTSGLTGGDAYKMHVALENGKSMSGGFLAGALTKALAVAELNAAMGKIVAAPTAGSCGILPAVLLTLVETHNLSDETAVLSLFTASGFGMVIAQNASISGAQGGCQAECGSAAAMAAAAAVEMMGGTPAQSAHACAIAIKGMLGLVCDPVAGLVEIPCIKRNAIGTATALAAAEMALAGIESKIPADEVIVAMKHVGHAMPSSLRETAEGGLAVSPTGLKLKKQVFGT